MYKTSSAFLKSTVIIGAFAALSGCALPPTASEIVAKATPDLSVLLDEADKVEPKTAAIGKYEAATKLFPASKTPWLKIAQLQFDAGNYGEAIIAGQQVLARDNLDKVANSILSVSGLRVATKALGDLSRQNELNGSVKNEAQDLAKVLRENLGEKVLVPSRPVVEAPRPASARARPQPQPARPAPSVAIQPVSGGSPFGNLK